MGACTLIKGEAPQTKKPASPGVNKWVPGCGDAGTSTGKNGAWDYKQHV